MRQHHPYDERVVFYTVVSSILMLWLLYEVMQRYRQDKAFQLRFMMGVVLCGIGLRVARMVFVLQQTDHPDNLMQESLWPAMLRNTSVSMDVLVLSSLLAYSTYLLAWRYQKSAEDNQAVREAHQELQKVVQEKDQMLKALTTATKTRQMGVVLASVAHELSQPLATLRLKTEFLLSQTELPTAERKTLLADMLQDNVRAAGIVVELRRFLQQGSSEKQSIPLDRILKDALDMLSPELSRPDLRVELSVQAPVWVQGVESQLQMVVLNLIKNALDAVQTVPSPHLLQVSLTSSAHSVRLEIADNGPGVPEALQERVFDMFFSTKADGMGVGLWLSRSIMQHHGGEMTVSRSTLGGACFTLSWPLPAQTP
jgi:C4-dicarboxylate-specific signal transduction histidine kinase